MRVVFIGCVQFSFVALSHLLSFDNPDLKIVGVVTRESSTFNADFASLVPLAAGNNIPYFIDNAAAVPFIGNDIRNIGADIIMYSTDKAMAAPIGGLIIGTEEIMVPFRRVLGTHGSRTGAIGPPN